jgi:hypothetical protein
MVLFAIGLGAFVLRDNGDDAGPNDGGVGTAPSATTNAPADTSATTVATTAAPATTAVTAATTAPTTAASSASTVTSASATTASAATTTPSAAPTPAPNDSSTRAVATAQALLDALADGRWNDARTLNPGRNESDAFLQAQYGPLEQATIVPARITPEANGLYDLRFGIVAHEAQPTGEQTVLLCSHWMVDLPTQTVQRIASARLRVEGGYVDPAPIAPELSTTCQAVPTT